MKGTYWCSIRHVHCLRPHDAWYIPDEDSCGPRSDTNQRVQEQLVTRLAASVVFGPLDYIAQIPGIFLRIAGRQST